jgi:predicted nucleic acid-binding Zn ribbon protein
MRKHGSVPASAALSELIGAMESGPRILASMAVAYWPDVVGPQAAAATEAETVRDGVLFVRTRSSAWSHELSFLRETLVTRLNERIGRPVIRGIRFSARGAPAPRQPAEPVQPVGEALDRVELPPEIEQQLQREMREIAKIGDERLRSAVARAMSRGARARWWRLHNGWRECPSCGAPHRASSDLCPICARSR